MGEYIFDMPHGGELARIAFFRQDMCRSTLSGRVSPRFLADGVRPRVIWRND